MYTRHNNDNIIIILVYVDNILIFWKDEDEMKKIKKDLTAKFEMKDLGRVKLMCGIRIRQLNDSIQI